MFGIKKLQLDADKIKNDITHLRKEQERLLNTKIEYSKVVIDILAKQKLDISAINNRFHEVGTTIEKSQKYMEILSEEANRNSQISRELLEKVVTNEAILCHVKELNEKLNFLYDYMRQLEKLLGNVELIVDQCLPEKTLKLPKKKKTS
jgi:hypothetical protein